MEKKMKQGREKGSFSASAALLRIVTGGVAGCLRGGLAAVCAADCRRSDRGGENGSCGAGLCDAWGAGRRYCCGVGYERTLHTGGSERGGGDVFDLDGCRRVGV